MASIILHQVGQTAVGMNSTDGFINATAMAKGHRERTGQRKDVADWLRLNRTKETLEHLSTVTGIPVTALYQVFQGGNDQEQQGTWIHPRLAVRFGMWLSDDFGLTVEDWVSDWNGTRNSVVSLPPYEEAVKIADSVDHISNVLSNNPRLAQILIDHAMNEVVGRKALPAATVQRGVVEIATEMGYKVNASSRVKLGQFVKSQGFDSVKEERLCNGVMMPINCYPDTPALRQAISTFFL